MSKTTIGYRFSVRKESQYSHAYLELLEGVPTDAEKEFTANLDRSGEDYYRKRLNAVKEACDGNPIYLREQGRNSRIEIRWQANMPGVGHESMTGKWYAPCLEMGFDDEAVKLLSRVRRAVEKLMAKREAGHRRTLDSCIPLDIVQALGTSAWQVKYGSNVDMWLMLPGQPEQLDCAFKVEEEACVNG